MSLYPDLQKNVCGLFWAVTHPTIVRLSVITNQPTKKQIDTEENLFGRGNDSLVFKALFLVFTNS